MSFEWAKAQNDYFKWSGCRKTGKIWVIALIKSLWDVAWDQSRNEALYNTPMKVDTSGTVSLHTENLA